jgi:sulfite reductase (NADPH) flavoprotein alpha-component
MLHPRTRARLAAVHGWTALVLSPVIALILLSGIVLAFRPILGVDDGDRPSAAPRIDPARLVAMLQRVDPAGRSGFLFVQDDGRTVTLPTPGPGPAPSYDLATARPVPTPPPPREDHGGVFDAALRIHKDLWRGLGWLTSLASLAMIVLVALGPLMSRPRRPGKTTLGWHMWAGWVAWPLMALLPASLVMMKLHLPVFTGSGPSMPLAEAVGQAARTMDLAHLRAVQSLPNRTAMLVTEDARGGHRWVVHDGRVRPFGDTGVSRLGREIHEGTWAGPWSGILNLLAALGLLAMLGTGVWSWLRRLRRGRASPPVEPRAHRDAPEPAMAAD